MDDELERIWNSSRQKQLVSYHEPALFNELDSKLNEFEMVIKKRDRREITTASIFIPICSIAAFFTTGLTQIGLILACFSCILIIYMLIRGRRHRVENYAVPVETYLIQHKQYLIKQRALLNNVLYWYILPIAISCVLFMVGLNPEKGLKIPLVIVIPINILVYYLNKMAVKKVFDPLIEKISSAINSLNNPNL